MPSNPESISKKGAHVQYQFRLYRLKLNEIKGLLAFTGLELEYVQLKESYQLF